MKIALTGGGTAGHVTPHLALISELKKHFSDIIYIGSKSGIEKEIIGTQGIKYYSTTTTKLVRKHFLKNLTIPFKLLHAIREAKKILKIEKPNVIFSKGGFVSLPTVLAGHRLHIPIIIHESDLSLGLANKIASRYADVVCTTFKSTATSLKNGLYTGSPIRTNTIEFKNPFHNSKPIITITGGSQGAQTINKIIRQNLPTLCKDYNIIHIVGRGNSIHSTQKGYVQIEFTDNILSIFRQSHIVISRAGSNTIFELLKLKVPMLLIPLPKGNSRGDQVDNAHYFKSNGFAEVLQQNELNSTSLLAAINHIENNYASYKNNMGREPLPDSKNLIINEILKLVKR